MPISDAELQTLHDATQDEQLKELLAELTKARQALPLAQKISQLGLLIDSHLFTMKLQEAGLKPEELFLAIIRRKADGSGMVGPQWALEEFHQDLKKLGEFLLDEKAQMELKAASILSLFNRG